MFHYGYGPWYYQLASCPLGPATAHGVSILTELCEGPRFNASTFLRRTQNKGTTLTKILDSVTGYVYYP